MIGEEKGPALVHPAGFQQRCSGPQASQHSLVFQEEMSLLFLLDPRRMLTHGEAQCAHGGVSGLETSTGLAMETFLVRARLAASKCRNPSSRLRGCLRCQIPAKLPILC